MINADKKTNFIMATVVVRVICCECVVFCQYAFWACCLLVWVFQLTLTWCVSKKWNMNFVSHSQVVRIVVFFFRRIVVQLNENNSNRQCFGSASTERNISWCIMLSKINFHGSQIFLVWIVDGYFQYCEQCFFSQIWINKNHVHMLMPEAENGRAAMTDFGIVPTDRCMQITSVPKM